MAHPLSIQLYTLREQLEADRDGTLARLAGIGYTSVEPYDPTADPAGFRKTADELGITVTSTHAISLLHQDPDEVFDAAAALGTDRLIIPGGIPEEDFTGLDGVERAANLLNSLSDKAASRGMRIGYHNHWWEIEPRLDGRTALEVLAAFLAPEVFLEVDTYWAHVGGADVPALLRTLGERVTALHIKDGPGVKGEPNTAVGRGRIDVPAILAAAPGAVRIVELDTCAGDVFEAVADSHTYLTGSEGAR
ncbi:sugar phosphate isomerase/epimerase family protein [Streptomyces longwoodensis]|uniref:sugar phosphate isomerase/epimerase family protein n=1 Tax=Streptomyces longwoodensis TaxID=68231 RepID=UPI00340D0DFC